MARHRGGGDASRNGARVDWLRTLSWAVIADPASGCQMLSGVITVRETTGTKKGEDLRARHHRLPSLELKSWHHLILPKLQLGGPGAKSGFPQPFLTVS